jgi:hypothetical protein
MNMDWFLALKEPQYWSEMLTLQLSSCADFIALATAFCACVGFLITHFVTQQDGSSYTQKPFTEWKVVQRADPVNQPSQDYIFNLKDMLTAYYLSCSRLSACLDEKDNPFGKSALLSIEEREKLDDELNHICSMTNQIIVYLNLTAPEEEGVRQLLMNINLWGYEIIKSIAENNRKESQIWKKSFDEHIQDVQTKLNARLAQMY